MRRGGCAIKKCCEATFEGADGVVLIKQFSCRLNEPPRPRQSKEPSGYFFDGAATPPFPSFPRRGFHWLRLCRAVPWCRVISAFSGLLLRWRFLRLAPGRFSRFPRS